MYHPDVVCSSLSKVKARFYQVLIDIGLFVQMKHPIKLG